MGEYTLNELAIRAGVTARTVRYYIAQGLIPAPVAAGPATRYTDAHLERLSVVRAMQREHLPLAEIRQRLAALDDEEIHDLANRPRVADTSALAYVRRLLHDAPRAETVAQPAAFTPASARPLSARASSPHPAEPAAPPQARTREVPRSMPSGRSQWDRLVLAPGVELHIQRPLTRLQNRRVERLVAFAAQLFEEDMP